MQRNFVQEFFATLPHLNRLLIAIEADIGEVILQAGCRALGLVDFLIIRPLFVFMRQSRETTSLLDMNHRYETLLDYCEATANAPTIHLNDITASNKQPYPDMLEYLAGKESELWKSLTTSSPESDALTMDAFKMIIACFVSVIRRQLGDHLPGGALRTVTSPLIKDYLTHAPKDNVRGERDFAQLDHLISAKPNQSLLSRESSILFSNNETFAWLKNLDMKGLRNAMSVSSKLAPAVRNRWRAAEEQVLAKRREALSIQALEK